MIRAAGAALQLREKLVGGGFDKRNGCGHPFSITGNAVGGLACVWRAGCLAGRGGWVTQGVTQKVEYIRFVCRELEWG